MSGWREIAAAADSERAALTRSLRDPATQQQELLLELVRANRDTQFGREHGFGHIHSIDAFRERVPQRRDEDFAAWIAATANGHENVLTREPIVAFESTGGTSSGRKIIPYTESSLRAFRAGVLPWLSYLLERRPGIMDGVAYVAASPAMRAPQRLPCGLPLGLPSDAAYLGADLAPALGQVITVPPESFEIERWKIATLAHLVKCADLTLISVWSPTYLLELLEALPRQANAVFAELRAQGETSAMRRCEHALRTPGGLVEHLWPRLAAISMWMDGASAPYVARVAALLPGVHLDGKGVLATESVVTVRSSDRGCVVALNSAFIEFIDDDGRASLAHELRIGRRYRSLLTTPGGLYRYDLGDEFECNAIHDGVCHLQFIGRAGVMSDLVGEKLTDSFVAGALASIDHAASLVPQLTPNPHYELWLDSNEAALREPLAMRVDSLLKANPQYAYARRLGQLREPVAICAPGFAQFRARRLAATGRRFGDAKSCALILDRTTLPPLPRAGS